MKKTLIILAHPNIAESRLNKTLLQELNDNRNVTIHDIYATYHVAENIDVAKEQALLVSHDRIIFQFPLYWFSTPSLLKEWQDKVLTYGFAYGSEGNQLANKEFKVVVTTGGAQSQYQEAFAIDNFLLPFQGTAFFTQMLYTPAFAVYKALEITDEALSEKALEYKALLAQESWSV